MRRRQYVNKDDIVLVSRREFEQDKVDIIHVYKNDHYRAISKYYRAPENLLGDIISNDENCEFKYDDEDDIQEKRKASTYNMADYMPTIESDEYEYEYENVYF